MRPTLLMTLIFSLLLCGLVAQETTLRPVQWSWKKVAAVSALGATSGGAWGINQMIHHHKSDAEKLFGNPNKWDPDITWRRKYRNGDPEQGERFPGAASVFVWATDWDHATATIHSTGLVGMGFCISIGAFGDWKRRTRAERKKIIWHTLAYSAIGYAAHGLAFHTVYTWLPQF